MDDKMGDFMLGFAFGALFMIIISIGTWMHYMPPERINECRAANPGFECALGYIKSEPF